MNWVIARCSCGQSYVLQCKSFKLLYVIPDLFYSFKHKPETTQKYFPGRRKPFFCSSLLGVGGGLGLFFKFFVFQ